MQINNSINKIKSQDPDRKALNAIYFDGTNQKVVASDGNVMVVHEPSEPIVNTMLVSIPKIKGKKLDVNLDKHTVSSGDQIFPISVVDKDYPDWTKVVPTGSPEYTIGLSVELLYKLMLDFDLPKNSKGVVKLSFYDKSIIKVTNNHNNSVGYLVRDNVEPD